MDEHAALVAIAERLAAAGDDAAMLPTAGFDAQLVVSTDMLHASTDFPTGTTAYTRGWRAVGASLSDIAAMGARPVAAVAVIAETALVGEVIDAVIDGAEAVCESVGAPTWAVTSMSVRNQRSSRRRWAPPTNPCAEMEQPLESRCMSRGRSGAPARQWRRTMPARW